MNKKTEVNLEAKQIIVRDEKFDQNVIVFFNLVQEYEAYRK